MQEYMMNGESMNIIKDNIEKLKTIFPDVFTENKIDFDKLQSILGNYVESNDERYNFTWAGKQNALRLAQTPSTGTLRPCKEDSKDWDTTENLYIEGDNLEVLKLLQKTYHNKIRMIYIDPPYNTGRDFVYADNFKDSIEHYKKITGQIDEDGNCISTNSDGSGRYHTNWLNMMYPRLKLARNLLSENGVIFISIDDNEVENMKKICNEIFGEGNFVGCAGRITKKSNNKGDYWAPNFDYLLTYVKNINMAEEFLGGINHDAYNLIETDGPRKGEKYQLVRLYMSTIQNRNPEQRFWIDCPDGSKIIPPGTTFPPDRPNLGDGIWRWSRKTFEENKDRIVIKQVKSSNLLNEEKQPAKWNVYTKTYLNDVIDNSSAKPNSFIEGHINQIGSHELNALDIPFDYAKPTTLIKYLLEVSKTNKDSIVLDFFSGSATTADACMQLNSIDGGCRKFIMVQIPEKTEEKSEAYKAGYKNLCSIGKERIRRAGEKIKQDIEKKNQQLKLDEKPKCIPDIGFKVFKLDSSNIKKWNVTTSNIEEELSNSLFNYVEGRSNFDIVYEIMLKCGLDLTYPIEEIKVGDKTIYSIGAGAMFVCVDKQITTDIADKIIEIKEENDITEPVVVFYDNGFIDDSTKTNIKESLRVAGIKDFITV